MLGGLVVGAAALAVTPDALAKPGKPVCSQHHCSAGVPCCDDKVCCAGTCRDESDFQTDPNHCGSCGHKCPPGHVCKNGHCACPSGKVPCNGACVTPQRYSSDEQNCGACGHVCPHGATCVKGECHCPRGTVVCGDACISPDSFSSDPHNCGACGHDCTLSIDEGGIGASAICVAGTCVCPPGKGCSGDATCVGVSQTVTTAGTCCSYPQRAECCSESAPGKGDGFARCCTPGVDCLFSDDPNEGALGHFACPGVGYGGSGSHSSDQNGYCTTLEGGDSTTVACLLEGQPCNQDGFPCCLADQYDPINGVDTYCNSDGICAPKP
jgi:hypothetical protein